MVLIPAPVNLAPGVLGVSVLRSAVPLVFAIPAHALTTLTVVLQGHLSPVHDPLSILPAGTLLGGGSATQAHSYMGSAGLVCASLLCRASLLAQLTGEPASLFCDAAVPPQVFGSVDLDRLMLPGASDEVVARVLFSAVGRRLRAARAPRATALRFAQAMAAWSEACLVHTVTPLPDGWSKRQWQRACQAELGVTPKLLSRLARLHASVRLGPACSRADWAGHAIEAGFYDQAHMGREYRLLAGVSPAQRLGRSSPLWLGASQLAPSFFNA